ncbi:DUF1801 domain-containing protein [Reinekea sp. G2M2-21]|uniref:DUF1801 domain-containing protein n=1 Tax=Reinekea sp. G2M2-21 TaxID=2788942 RepID=UPI0018AB9208|nr:DUF1801 domain-containing protein [Reinekea sp. G2M2-21]
MAKADNKTKPTDLDVGEFIASIVNPQRQSDCKKLIEMMRIESGCEPVMWGSIVGFGEYHYRYESGREGDFMRTGFANRKSALTVYIMAGFDTYPDLMAKLGKFKTGKSCLYIKSLDDVDTDVLRRLVRESLDFMAATYGAEKAAREAALE